MAFANSIIFTVYHNEDTAIGALRNFCNERRPKKKATHKEKKFLPHHGHMENKIPHKENKSPPRGFILFSIGATAYSCLRPCGRPWAQPSCSPPCIDK